MATTTAGHRTREMLTFSELSVNLEALLDHTAELVRPCKECQVKLWFVRHKNGKLTPYTIYGVNHFANCPAAAKFKTAKPLPPQSGKRLGYCSSCRARLELQLNGTVPPHLYDQWSEVGIAEEAPACVGGGRPALNIADLPPEQQSTLF